MPQVATSTITKLATTQTSFFSPSKSPPPQRLQLLHRPRPILPQQPRQTPIRQHPPARLASRAIIRLILRIPNPLNFLPASRTGQPIPPMHRHILAKRRHLLRKSIPSLGAQPLDPHRQHIARSRKQPHPLLILQPVRKRHRRKFRRVQNFIRIRITNPANHPRISKRPLQRAILLRKRRSKRSQIAHKYLNPARINRAQSLLARHHMQRRPPLRPSLRHHQRPTRKIKSRQTLPPRKPRPRRPPMQSSGNHQMQHQPQIPIHPNRNPLPNPPHPAHHPPLHLPNPRLHSPQQKSITQSHAHKRPPNHTRFQRRNVSRNVRQLRHSPSMQSPPSLLQLAVYLRLRTAGLRPEPFDFSLVALASSRRLRISPRICLPVAQAFLPVPQAARSNKPKCSAHPTTVFFSPAVFPVFRIASLRPAPLNRSPFCPTHPKTPRSPNRTQLRRSATI